MKSLQEKVFHIKEPKGSLVGKLQRYTLGIMFSYYSKTLYKRVLLLFGKCFVVSKTNKQTFFKLFITDGDADKSLLVLRSDLKS